HRDIKPDNLLVNAQGKAVLLDFGLAFLEGEERFTSPGELLGTPLYMAPESIEHGCFDARSDVYALGLSLYEAVTLSHPFGGSETRAQTFQQVLADRIPDARSQQPLLSRDAAAVLMRAVERDPKDRYGSAAEFAEDLRRLLDLEPTKARPVSGVGAAWRRVRRRPRLAVLLTVLALTMLGLLVLLDENRELRDGIAAAGRDLMQGDAAQASRRLEELMRSADGLVGQPGVHAIHPRGDTPALDRLQWLGNESVGPATGPYAHRYRVTVQRDGVEVFRGEHRQPHGVVWCELALPDSLREMSGADGWTWRVEWLDDGRKVPEDLHATMLADPVGRRMVLAEAAFTIVPFEQRGFDPRDGSVAAERVRALIDAGYASRALSLLMRAADDGELPRARRLELQATAAAALGDEWLERASRAALEGR
ncbi:MAG: serine/threonine protein kinase, partial [Planctomycetes bacterium]|nr:serine/threonine protein kinase [Planctomycetota bacterium]